MGGEGGQVGSVGCGVESVGQGWVVGWGLWREEWGICWASARDRIFAAAAKHVKTVSCP